MFLFHKWLELNINTRHKIAAQFNIVKRGSTEVVDNIISNDGYKIKEIEEALNIDAIQTYLDTQEADMTKLWVMLINKIEGRSYVDDVQPPVQEPKVTSRDVLEDGVTYHVDQELIDSAKKAVKNKGGRPKKNA